MLSTTYAVLVLVMLNLRDRAKREENKFDIILMDCLAMFWFIMTVAAMVTGR